MSTKQLVVEPAGLAANSPGAFASRVAEASQFEDAWNIASLEFGELEPDARTAGGLSTLTKMALRQSDMITQAHMPIDTDEMKGMSVIEVEQLMSQKMIALSNAKALIDVSWALLKSTRQSVDAVMNSK